VPPDFFEKMKVLIDSSAPCSGPPLRSPWLRWRLSGFGPGLATPAAGIYCRAACRHVAVCALHVPVETIGSKFGTIRKVSPCRTCLPISF